jgi:hypothetical protein
MNAPCPAMRASALTGERSPHYNLGASAQRTGEP